MRLWDKPCLERFRRKTAPPERWIVTATWRAQLGIEATSGWGGSGDGSSLRFFGVSTRYNPSGSYKPRWRNGLFFGVALKCDLGVVGYLRRKK